MNAIILAAGKSSRMYDGGAILPKGLLPILYIPNIERTIIMLRMIDVNEIIIAVPFGSNEFNYLNEKYSCTIVHIPTENVNTLTTLNFLISYIDNSYIIESDVVCAKNIFRPFKHSTYYVMDYPYPENDEWNVIMDSNSFITGFEIGNHCSPAIFGISYWTHDDCTLLKNYIKSEMKTEMSISPCFFWDDHIEKILNNICIKAYEIPSSSACEMNNPKEYNFATLLCTKMLLNTDNFFSNSYIKKGKLVFHIDCNKDKSSCLQWLRKLYAHYNETLDSSTNIFYDKMFSSDEYVYILKDNDQRECAFFSLIIGENYILIRRLFIDVEFRNMGIGKSILSYIRLFAASYQKELRVNVYNDDKAAKFYMSQGAHRSFSTYCW